MKAFGLHILLTMSWLVGVSQDMQQIDSLKRELAIGQNDTLKLLRFIQIAEAFEEIKPDSSYHYATNGLSLARKLKLRFYEASSFIGMAYALKNMGNYPASLQTYLSAKGILEDESIEETILLDKSINIIKQPRLNGFIRRPITPRMIRLQALGLNQLGLGLLYETANNFEKGLYFGLLAKQSFEEASNVYDLCLINMIIGRVYVSLNKLDSALMFEQTAHDLSFQWDFKDNLAGISINLGRIYLAMGRTPLAAEYFRRALTAGREQGYLRGVVAANLLLFDVYHQEGKKDSSRYFVHEALDVARHLNSPDLLLRTYTALATFYSSVAKNDSIVKYQSLIISIKDSLFNSKQAQQFQTIDFDDQQRRQEIEAAKEAYQDRLQLYSVLIGLVISFLIAIVLWRNNRHKQKAYLLLKEQKQETDFQKNKVEQTLEELKSTQSQLIQSEKMASLGELTAGIAHEIQNPLNFVNNFSEVNKELLSEMKEEIEKGNFEEAKSLAVSVVDNQEKINQHGKRAEAIVKSMLQHSRSSSGTKELTNINALADEYLKLAYHGFRAKDNAFNVALRTNFDESIGAINVIPQDIGRVILNLLNNAFYAVSEKRKTVTNYEPVVSLSTRKSGDKTLISVNDNGIGIPQKVLDKIFQPFFTTKPTGQGTGLGLSLSYDIVKAHGGDLTVQTKNGSGSEFVIHIPITRSTG
jgi:two-component system, NtrC family, sensor kinase